MYCFVVVFFLQFKQLQRVVTMALKFLYPVCKIKKLHLIFSSFSVRSQNHSYKNSIVFRFARHLCSSTSLVYIYVWTYVRHFCTLTLAFFVLVGWSTPSLTSLNRILCLSISTRITLEIDLFTVLNSFAGAVKTWKLKGLPFLFELVAVVSQYAVCHGYKPCATAFTWKYIVH